MALRLSTGLRDALLDTGSFKATMADGVIHIYSGSQPSDADSAETGTQLIIITESGGAFTSGVATNGLEFGTATSGVIPKAAAETWQGDALATGVCGWFRFYANTVVTGASTTGVRFDGLVATSGGQLNISATQVTSGATTTVDSFSVTMPASA